MIAALEMLQDLLALPEPAAVLASLSHSSAYAQLHHRWVSFPGIAPLGQPLQQGELDKDNIDLYVQLPKAVRSPGLMQLPHHFQVSYLEAADIVYC